MARETHDPTSLTEGSGQPLNDAARVDLHSTCTTNPAVGFGQSAITQLPLPYMKVGYFTTPPIENPFSPHSEWTQAQFVLNHEGLYQIIPDDDQKPSRRSLSSLPNDAENGARHSVKVEIRDIVSVSASADLTLPPGAGLCIDTTNGPVYLVAESWESLDGWVDALRLVYTIYAKGKSDVLAGVLVG